MDILAQAVNIVAESESVSGQVTLTLDLERPEQRAAYVAAIAVLHAGGLNVQELIRLTQVIHPVDDGTPVPITEAKVIEDEAYASLRDSYAKVLADLIDDETRRTAVARDTFPRVRELLRDGANIEAVAQIQYRRWVEERLTSNLGN